MTQSKLWLDDVIARLLFIDRAVDSGSNEGRSVQRAERAFGVSLAISAGRCILQYVLLPFVLPLVGLAAEVAVPISLAINVLAIGLIVSSLRRLWTIRYAHRWRYLPLALGALVFLLVFSIMDVQVLIGG